MVGFMSLSENDLISRRHSYRQYIPNQLFYQILIYLQKFLIIITYFKPSVYNTIHNTQYTIHQSIYVHKK